MCLRGPALPGEEPPHAADDFTAHIERQDGTTSDAVSSWAPAHENDRFEAVGGGTQLTSTQDMQEALRALCEAPAA